MPHLRLALAQVNPTVGDIAGNLELILDYSRQARERGADLVVFGEMALTGYPVEDLALRRSFVDASREGARRLAARLAEEGLGSTPVVVGYLDADESRRPATGVPSGAPQNRAAVLFGGEVAATYSKHHLPNYGVFDEFRIFVPGTNLTVFRTHGVDVALAICEDIWQDGGPVAQIPGSGADLTLVLNGSPYERDKDDTRLALARRRAAESDTTLAYVNLVGGQDDLVFDGDSLVVSPAGDVLARAPQFAEHLLVVDLELPDADEDATVSTEGEEIVRVDLGTTPSAAGRTAVAPDIAEPLDPREEVYRALETGLRDYVRKNGMKSVVLGLSGGIDSAFVAALAADALGGGNVVGVSMPSRYSSDHSKDDASDLAGRLGVDYRVQPIGEIVDTFEANLPLSGIAAENLQARVRGTILMGISNEEGHLTLATGNKTEVAVGYSTIYGDSVGGFAPIKDVPKTLVWELSKWRNEQAVRRGETPPIPENSITKPPSAELRPGQVDQDSLPPYEILDAMLEMYVGQAADRAELVAAGYDEAVVDKVVALVDRAEWKRRQGAPGTKISPVSFGRDRRLPITSRWKEQNSGMEQNS